MRGSSLPAFIVGLGLLVVIGCGPSRYQPSGKVTKGGAPLQLSDKAVLQLALYAESDTKFEHPYPVKWEKDGSFKVTGREGGIPAGKYLTSITIIDPYPNGKDLLDGKMKAGKGPAVEVKGGSEIVIDLPK